jgi:uncharacterized protein
MALRTDDIDLGRLQLSSGEGRKLEPHVAIEPIEFGHDRYDVRPALIATRLDIAKMTGDGYSLRLRFEAEIHGPCMRCLEPAGPAFAVDAREISQPGEAEELDSDYVSDQVLCLHAWARDALVLMLPAQIVCRPDCAGLCPVCGADLNGAPPDHRHDEPPDHRWAKLSEIRFQ